MKGTHEIIENEYGKYAIVRLYGGKFTVCRWNDHHKNWVRANRKQGGGIHRDLMVLANDNLGGGPFKMTLKQARSCVANADLAPLD